MGRFTEHEKDYPWVVSGKPHSSAESHLERKGSVPTEYLRGANSWPLKTCLLLIRHRRSWPNALPMSSHRQQTLLLTSTHPCKARFLVYIKSLEMGRAGESGPRFSVRGKGPCGCSSWKKRLIQATWPPLWDKTHTLPTWCIVQNKDFPRHPLPRKKVTQAPVPSCFPTD